MSKTILLLCLILSVVCSCGFKGPLYLPKKNQKAESSTDEVSSALILHPQDINSVKN